MSVTNLYVQSVLLSQLAQDYHVVHVQAQRKPRGDDWLDQVALETERNRFSIDQADYSRNFYKKA